MKKFGDSQKARVLKEDEALKETRKEAAKVKVWADGKFNEVSTSEDDREDSK